MLARYQIVRGRRQEGDPLPEGRRYDTRKHTQHILRPTQEIVEEFLSDPSQAGFKRFRAAYIAVLDERFAEQPGRFDALAQEARQGDVFLGCNCPTARQPDVRHCHTWLALEYFARKYPDLDVRLGAR
ncbi:hypothetical protein WME75_43380 [Sorangium sp. So ce1014]|uniref:hypothetical protein n=1 Tax=Sorangium sp. So ce1014 TaxID=3133326 RepID=UPI003F634D5D